MGVRVPKPQTFFTIDEYLELERQAVDRHEYMDGFIYAMAGESPTHGINSVNVVVLLGNQLKGTRCQAFTKDMKIRSGPTPLPYRNKSGLYSYPDVVVACGELWTQKWCFRPSSALCRYPTSATASSSDSELRK